MLSNPEFRKNLWLEINPFRLILMPTVLAGIFLVTYLGVDKGVSLQFCEALKYTSLVAFALIVFAWGTKLVSDSLVTEFNERTWDSQRMTSVGPWTMILGKIFGSTIYTWYGGLICIVVCFIASSFIPEFHKHIKLMLIMIFSGLICHTLSLSLILEEFSKKRDRGKINTSSYIFLMLLGLYFIIQISAVSMNSTEEISWYFFECAPSTLILFSSIFFLVWSFTGLYRNMRIELQFANGPWVWVGFVLSIMIYFSGFVANEKDISATSSLHYMLYVSYITGIIITYCMAFIEPKYIVAFRRLIQAFQDKAWKELRESMPAWIITLVINVLVCALIIVLSPFFTDIRKSDLFASASFLFPLNLLLFMLRDLSILIYVNLKGASEKADMAAFFYLMILYILIPLIITIPGGEAFLPLFVPVPDSLIGNGTFPVLIQCIFAAYLLRKRWNDINQNLN